MEDECWRRSAEIQNQPLCARRGQTTAGKLHRLATPIGQLLSLVGNWREADRLVFVITEKNAVTEIEGN